MFKLLKFILFIFVLLFWDFKEQFLEEKRKTAIIQKMTYSIMGQYLA